MAMGPWEAAIISGAFALIFCAVFVLRIRQGRANRAFLSGVARAAGWTDIGAPLMAVGVKGTWLQLPARFSIDSGGEDAPALLILAVNTPSAFRAQSAALLRVTRKSAIFSFRPLKLMGPATAIDLGEPTSGFWVWGDRTTAVRVFADPAVVKLIGTNVVDGYDELLVYARGCRIRCGLRAYGLLSKEGADAKYGASARDQLVLAEALLGVLR
jgi:hypothetical protein